MVFSSPIFLSVFLPALFACYFFANIRARTYVLLAFSLAFYAWGEPVAVFVMIGLSLINFIVALLVEGCAARFSAAMFLGMASRCANWNCQAR